MLISHNSLTYFKPVKWWMRLFTPFAKCQNNPTCIQEIYGVRILDIRIRIYKEEWFVSHGIPIYANFKSWLKVGSFLGKIRKIRLLIEGKYSDNDIIILQGILKEAEEKYGYQFYECRDKKTWKQLLHYPPLEIACQYVGSMQSWIGKIFPIFWWILIGKKHQKEYIERSKTENISLDFI